jgi:hypothetical protein
MQPLAIGTGAQACPSLEFIIDGTERRINRPKDKEERKEHYSGKKKTFTVKNNVITQRGGKVLYLSDTYEGKKHDKSIGDEEDYRFPQGSKLWKDTGFQGYEPQGVETFQPKKKPRNGELNPSEKERNREISQQRVEIEHQIGGIKRCNIVVHPLRTRRDHFTDTVMEVACGLHNLRLEPSSEGYLTEVGLEAMPVFVQNLLISALDTRIGLCQRSNG